MSRVLMGYSVAAAFLLASCGPGKAERAAVNECDRQAAHPSDEQRVASGVKFGDIIPKPAVEACEKALQDFPDEPRLIYQLARALDAAGRSADAAETYERAMGKDYAMAFVGLGLQYTDLGRTEDAKALFEKAAALGSAMAKEELAKSTFVADGFSNPKFFQSIYDKSFAGRNGSQVIYVSTFISLFNNTQGCKGVATNGLNVRAGSLAQGAVLGQVFNALKQSQAAGTIGFKEGQEARDNMLLQTDSAQADANLFYSRYQCDTAVAKRFFENLSAWVSAD